MTTGTAVSATDSSSDGFVTDNLYLNNSTWDLWKCTGTDTWELQGNIEGATGATGQQGLPGENGQDGTDGTNGTNSYIWVRYSESADGTGFDATPTPAKKYMGVYAGTSSTAPTNKTAYAWVKYIGEDGVSGKDGNLNYYGTLITGNSTTPTAYATGITMARVNDSYTNTTTFFEYRCTVAGNATTAKWVYVGSKKGAGTWSDLGEKPFSSVGTNYLKVTSGVLDGDVAKLQALNVARADRLGQISVSATGTLNVNKWTKIGSFTSSGSYRGYIATLSVLDKSYSQKGCFITITSRVGNDINFVDTSNLFFRYTGTASPFLPESIKLVYTAPLFELWFNPLVEHVRPSITVLNEIYSTNAEKMTYYSDQPWQDNAPNGTVISCTPLSIMSSQLPTSSSSVKGGIKIGNGLVIASEVARLDKYTFTDTTIATTDFSTYAPSGAVETDLDTAGYGYKVHKALANVTANHEANVVFGAIEADSGNYASIATTEAGYVNIYAKAVPSSAITIPTIDCTYKGV